MPYIKQERRDFLLTADEVIGEVGPGELNFIITGVLDEWLSHHGLNYSNLNTVVGVLECVKQELYRRIAAPYEDTKIAENGDVFTCNLNK
jgi:broad-specificity NMP kinase